MNITTYSVGLFPPLFVWSLFVTDNPVLRSCLIRQANRFFSPLFLFSKFSELFPIFFVLLPCFTHQRLPATHFGGHVCIDTQKQIWCQKNTEKDFQWMFIALLYSAPPYFAFSCPFSSSLAWLYCSNQQIIFMGCAKHYTKEQIITGLFKLETNQNGQSGKGHFICFLAITRRYLVIFKALQCESHQRQMILDYAEALMHNHRI